MEGYIALHRKITENEIYFSERFTRFQAWIDLLILATHKARTIFIRGIEINLKAGDLCYSQLSLAKRWKWNKRTVRKFIDFLEKAEMVHCKITNITTVISVKNYSKYQFSKNDMVKTLSEVHNKVHSKVHTNNNVNKNKSFFLKKDYEVLN